MRIIYLGTPAFAVPPLRALLDYGYEVPAVVTAPDKPGGRLGLQQSAVKTFALERGLTVLQPEKLKNPDFLEQLRSFEADLQVVVAFRMLPERVWNMPPMGTMNLHGSLLPKYRGAAPINWAIINGEQETGLTTFLLKHEIDTGDLLFQQRIPIDPDETAGELHDRMMELGASLVLQSVQALEKGQAQPFPQPDSEATHAPKIFTETCQIDFNRPVNQVYNFIRGLSPSPGAWTYLDGKTCKIVRCKAFMGDAVPGQWYSNQKNILRIGAIGGWIDVQELKLEGKKQLQVEAFLNGYRVQSLPV
jgi:methionyl-tRNA formyltransferase